jgi:hypothetical protein
MRINHSKSELIPMGLELDEVIEIARILGYYVGDFPIKNLGIPLHHEKLKRSALQPLIDKILKRIARWRGKLLSYAGRVILILLRKYPNLPPLFSNFQSGPLN